MFSLAPGDRSAWHQCKRCSLTVQVLSMGYTRLFSVDHLLHLAPAPTSQHVTPILTIQVLRMRVEAPGVLQAGLKPEFTVLGEPWAPKI